MTPGAMGEAENLVAGRRGVYVHAPTLTVSLLRDAAGVVEAASAQLPGETIFFPEKESGERQPVHLGGYVPLGDLAGLLRYLADMLEP